MKNNKQGYYKKTVICTNGFEIVTKCQMPGLGKNGRRAKKSKPTTEQKKQYNLRKAAEKLYYLLLCNFFPGDYNLAFTYPKGKIQTAEEADKIFTKFWNLYKAHFGKLGLSAHCIHNTEIMPSIHHHAVLHNHGEKVDDIGIIERLWEQAGGGEVQYRKNSKLWSNYDWYGLAMYYVDRTKGGKYPDTHVKGKRRYVTSHGLKRPIVKIERVEAARWHKPKAKPGYEIIPESVYSGTHELTGASFIKYTMRRLI